MFTVLLNKILGGAAYVLTGADADATQAIMSDVASSFLQNFLLVLKFAIPLIVVYVIIRLVRGYIGR